MSSLSPQLQRPYQRLVLRLELWLFRRRFLREIRRESEDALASDHHVLSWRSFARPFLICLRVLGVLLLSAWFIAALYDLGPLRVRPLFFVVGAVLCWWVVGMLED